MAAEVLCIGAGLSGCVAAHFVKEVLPAARVHVWDGARGAGGRLASARFGDGDAVRANMGAQELHFEEDGGPGEQIARVLIEAGAYEREGVGVLVPLGDSNAACRQLLGGVETRFGARVREIRGPLEGGGYEVQAFGDAEPRRFDAVIFCGSVAEVMTTHGDLDRLVAPFRGNLRDVRV